MVDGGTSFIKAYRRLDAQSDTLTRDATQSSTASCGESSSESVASTASLNSQASPPPASGVGPHRISEDHPICAAKNRVHRSTATKTSREKNERTVVTTPLNYEYEEIANMLMEMFPLLP
jgi:hypothetical protein